MSLSEYERLLQLGANRTRSVGSSAAYPQEVSDQRELFNVYTNDTGSLLYLHIWGGVAGTYFSIVVYSDVYPDNTLEIGPVAAESGDFSRIELTALIPPGAGYEVTSNIQNPGSLVGWVEQTIG